MLTSTSSSSGGGDGLPSTPGILRRTQQQKQQGQEQHNSNNRRLQFLDNHQVHVIRQEPQSPPTQQPPPPARASASQRLEVIASQMQQRHEQMYQQQVAQQQSLQLHGGGIGPNRGANWPPSRKREEASALRNLRRALANRVLHTGDEDDEEDEQQQKRNARSRQHQDEDERTPGDIAAERLAELAVDNRRQLIEKMWSSRPVALVSERHEADTDWHESDFISECLCWHNVYRQRHGVRELVMSVQLCDMAQDWANTLAHTNTFLYKPAETQVGQNLFCRLPNSVITDVSGQEVSSYWYSACKQYNYMKEPDVLHANVNGGHFTQMVWASTRELGVGMARSRQGKTVVVAMYRPAGNQSGLFQENVLPPLTPAELERHGPASLSGSESSSASYSSA